MGNLIRKNLKASTHLCNPSKSQISLNTTQRDEEQSMKLEDLQSEDVGDETVSIK